ncbi:MAG: hypothetical protein A2297_09570 [Elusimicrobia bacterium RIFOXYB2_FULL_48_7]|nr:MAG: hypothetical protein A2297_09570 [Elusimicrobia bacterium RIFOXYB2_FULL_48_7]
MEIFAILGITLLLTSVPLFVKGARKTGIINSAGYFIVLAVSLILNYRLLHGRISFSDFFYVDSLSGYFLLLIAVVSFASSLYSIGYIESDVTDKAISEKESRLYYALFNLFAFTMFFCTVVNNLGIMWVFIEMTTLTSAFLVGFYKTQKSIEAAWKYIIICSVGITLALFGIILFYFTVSSNGGIRSLNWTDIMAVAPKLDPKIIKIAFLFILVGYGTKAGIAPMHTWLPDAHSQALTPISALLSGVLLKTALYAILRFTLIMNKSIGPGYTGNLFVFFGLLSLALSAGFIIAQKDIKRLLAYSSIEHMGIIFVGLGIGGPLGLFGALFHMFNHAVTKSLMFFGAGNIVKKYGTHNMRSIHGVTQALPFTGIFVVAGVFALGGSPLFSIFISEMMILIAGFTQGAYASMGIFLFLISIIFGALVYHFNRMAFGRKPEDMQATKEPLGGKLAFIFLAVLVIVFGITMPAFFDKLIKASVDILNGL